MQFRARVFALWLALLVSALPVQEAYGAIACARMGGPAATDSAMVDAHAPHGNHQSGPGQSHEGHTGCTWLGLCSATPAVLGSGVPPVQFLDAFVYQNVEWTPEELDLLNPLGFLKPFANAPPSAG